MYFLNLEVSYAPNSVCITCSKIIKEEQKCYVILRYFDIFKTLKNHINFNFLFIIEKKFFQKNCFFLEIKKFVLYFLLFPNIFD